MGQKADVGKRDLEGLSLKIGKLSRIPLEAEGQHIGVEGLVAVLSLLLAAVFAVAKEGMTDVGHMGTDLVGPAGVQLHLQQRLISFACKDLIFGKDPFAVPEGRLFIIDLHGVGTRIFDQIPRQQVGLFGGIPETAQR